MITCKICQIEKPETEYYFFKNGDGVERRRHRCKSCITKREGNRYWHKKGVVIPDIQIIKKGRPEDPIEEIDVLSQETIQCSKCLKVKSINHFYVMNKKTGRRHKRCKICYNSTKRTELKDVWTNLDYRQKPGEWISEEQRDVVHKMMHSFGWSYNKAKNLWYKIPQQKDIIYKDKDGVWHNLNTNKFKPNRTTGRKSISIDIEKVIELYNSGMSYKAIAKKFGITYNTLKNKVYEYNLKN